MPISTTAPADSQPATMTVEQAAALLGLSRSAAYRAVAAAQLPAIRLGRRLLIPTAKLDELLGRRSSLVDRLEARDDFGLTPSGCQRATTRWAMATTRAQHRL